MKVAHIIESLDSGGAERVLLDIIRLNPTHDIVHEVICLASEGALAAEVREMGIKVRVLGKKIGWDASLLPKLAAHLVETKADLLHLHLFTGGLWGRLASWLTDIPCVLGVQNVDAWIDSWRLVAEKALAPVPRKTVGVTRASLDLRLSWGMRMDRVEVIPNGSSRSPAPQARQKMRQLWGFKSTDFVVGSLGRGVAQKNPQLFLQVVQKAVAIDPRLKFVWMGEGPALEALKKSVVRLVGHLTEPMEGLAACDALLSTSLREGFSLSLLEGMRSGLPVLATDIPGNRDLLENSGFEALAPSGNEAAWMSEKLALLCRDPSWARKAGEKSRAHAMKFLAEDMAAAYAKVYREAVAA